MVGVPHAIKHLSRGMVKCCHHQVVMIVAGAELPAGPSAHTVCVGGFSDVGGGPLKGETGNTSISRSLKQIAPKGDTTTVAPNLSCLGSWP